ncbi:MAG: FAD-dependent oxidoreductase [Pseudomonadales bacterium]|nr:FAD-dependent oxidoreductase [Pseudomonadales bacterium]
MRECEKLFSPVSIGGMQLKNRLVMSPMTTDYGNEDQTPSQRLIDYLSARARGGVGLITAEVCTVDIKHRYLQRSLTLGGDEYIGFHKVLTDEIHRHGACIQPQITHPGPESLSAFFSSEPAIGPSPVVSPVWGGVCRELEVREIPVIIDQYAEAVLRAFKAGYDGVELHAAHSYHLLGSFLSPWRNKRRDEYGGHRFETRSRLLLEVVAAIRERVPRAFPLTVRLSGYERAPGGLDVDEIQRLAPMLVEAGVDAFHMSGGVSDRLVSQIVVGGQEPIAYNAHIAETIKQVVDVPVMVVGRIHDPREGEKVLQANQADLIVMGRPFLADAELPNKARAGKFDDIRYCLSCENCIDAMARGTLNCAVNASTGRENELDYARTAQARKVMIIGGGPAGMEAARVASLRGHHVSLYEQQLHLGGSVVLASTVHKDNEPILHYLKKQLSDLPVKVYLGKKVDEDLIREVKPDVAILATGAKLVTQSIPGDHLPNVITGQMLRELLKGDVSPESYRRFPWLLKMIALCSSGWAGRFINPARLRMLTRIWMPLGRRIVIIGGDLAALELAEFLAARKRKIYLFETSNRLAPEVGKKRRAEHMDKLDRLGVVVNSGVTVREITPTGVIISASKQHEKHIAADSVIVAGEPVAASEFLEKLEALVPEVHAIGDCTGLGLIVKAIDQGSTVANQL